MPLREILRRCRGFLLYAWLFSFAIDVLLLTPPLYMLNTLDRIASSRSNETLAMLSLIALFALVIEALLETLRTKLLVRFSIVLQRLLGEPIVQVMLRVRADGDTRRKHGLEELNTIQQFITGNGCRALFDLPWIPIYLFILMLFHPYIVYLTMVIIGLLAVAAVLEEKTAARHQKASTVAQRQVNTFMTASMQNAEVVGALGMQGQITERWAKMNEKYVNAGKKASDATSSISSVSKFLRYSSQILGLAICAYLMINDQSVTPGIMVAGSIIMGRAMAPIDRLLGAWKSFVNAREAYKNLNELLLEHEPQTTRVRLPEPKGELSVERLLFFHHRDREVLSGLQFRLDAGEHLGVIGPSGSGKTSLARLLVGIHKPQDGSVRLDGADVHQWIRDDLGQYLGYLPQTVTLFAGSVAENIARLGDPNACSAEIVAAAKLARVHEMILQLPQGYETPVGESGNFLSGGQRQQIGLARALFGNPKLVVLDEPNANLDGQSELGLQDVFKALKQQSVTLVVISHKPSVLKDMDKLLVLHRGRQSHFGPYKEIFPKLQNAQDPGIARPLVRTVS